MIPVCGSSKRMEILIWIGSKFEMLFWALVLSSAVSVWHIKIKNLEICICYLILFITVNLG